jgi:hypothetical protein
MHDTGGRRHSRRAILAGVLAAVLVEGGGTGANSAGPIANAFLRNL